MNHGRKVPKLQRKASHRKALLANLVCALIEHRRIRTTLAKAKAVRPLAEKMVTLGKRGDLHARRTAVSSLRHPSTVKQLFEEISVASKDRKGGYTRITKLGQRRSDSAPMAFIEWVDAYVPKTTKALEAEVTPVEVEAPAEEVAAAPKKRVTKKAKEVAAE
ncbi:MAG: 50S ribosomal protein L17 [Verrucomicrobia bacterium]|nr:50S ribosomal protein L17 [Verrucomicrobiota bacterium]